MPAEKTAVRLRVNTTIDAGDGTMRQRSRTFANIAFNANDQQLYAVGNAVASLLVGDLNGVYKLSEEKITV